ncbi:hypothetical protein GCK32_000881 [Trichostrongylus colubriformis]|uniref:CWH43-like N-terminal domain-containing protein n=1 Tax=Trichostrongylus colubriformis TaxID=6319 RepID=A0AAN8IFM4_TRICO
MSLDFVWLCPVVTAIYSLLCLTICFALSAYYNQLPPRLPLLSELATRPPASSVYAMMTNHIAVLAAIWLYLKHREFVSYFSHDHRNTWQRKASFAAAGIGLLGVACLQMSVNFPRTKVPYIQFYSNMLLMACSVVYIWSHTSLSSLVIDANIARLKLFLVRTSLAAAFTSCCGSVLKVFIIRGHNFDRTTPSPLDDSSSGAAYEWGAYFFLCLFLLTDAYEFRNLVFRAPKLVIPGAPLYNAERMTPTSSPFARRRELSFTDLPANTLTAPLVL